MPVTNTQSGTRIDEVAERIFRIATPVAIAGGPGFSFNQYLILDAEPLIFHTGLRSLFPVVREAVASIIPVEKVRYIALSHVEADECGALNEWLAVAPHAIPVCSRVAAMTSINDLAARAPRPLQDNEVLPLGERSIRWFDTPHLPHGWESGLLMEERTRTLFCGDLFAQGGTRKSAAHAVRYPGTE
jgi:flavorubredoxin